MVRLVRHFGDHEDSQPCGVCDVCAPQAATARRSRRLTAAESRLALQVLETLRWREGQTVRQLHERLEGSGERRTFERLLESMAGAGLVEAREDAFDRDGKVISFWRVYLTDAGRASGVGAVGAVRLTEATTPRAKGRKRADNTRRSRRS
jgi:DNA topoisomerase-3